MLTKLLEAFNSAQATAQGRFVGAISLQLQ